MEKLSSLQLDLLEKGIIDLRGEVEDSMFEYVRECVGLLSLEDNPPIHVKITSEGGSVVSGLFIYDLLRLYPGHKTGVVIGFARSIAAVILQACDKREAAKNSLLLIHGVKIGMRGVPLDEICDNKEFRKKLENSRAAQEQIYLILKSKTKKSKSDVVALCKEDRDLLAKEALAFGLIDEII